MDLKEKTDAEIIDIIRADPEKIKELEAFLESSDADTRRRGVDIIGMIAEDNPIHVQDSIPKVMTILDDEDDFTRLSAARVMATLSETFPEDSKAAAGPMTGLLRDENLTEVVLHLLPLDLRKQRQTRSVFLTRECLDGVPTHGLIVVHLAT